MTAMLELRLKTRQLRETVRRMEAQFIMENFSPGPVNGGVPDECVLVVPVTLHKVALAKHGESKVKVTPYLDLMYGGNGQCYLLDAAYIEEKPPFDL